MTRVSQSVQKRMEQRLQDIVTSGCVPRLLLHSCCAPCSSAVIEMLSAVFALTVFYDNPNITDGAEYVLRKREQQTLIAQMPVRHPVAFVEGKYDPQRFWDIVQDGASDAEGGARCQRCYAICPCARVCVLCHHPVHQPQKARCRYQCHRICTTGAVWGDISGGRF